MGRSTVHYADNKTNNALKSLHNKLRPAGTPVQRVEYIIELLLLRIFETKIKQDEEFKPLRRLFSTDYKWMNPKTGKEESNENRLFSYLPSVSNDQILSELNDNFFPFYSSILQSARQVFEGNLPQKVQDQLVLIEEVFSNSNFTNNVNSGNLGEVISIVANDIEETRLLKTDLLGDAIESALSETGGTKDVGLFRTPSHIRQFMTALIEPTFDDLIFDPACGTGGFLFDAFEFVMRRVDPDREWPGEKANSELSEWFDNYFKFNPLDFPSIEQTTQFYRSGVTGIEYLGMIRKMAAINFYIRGLNPANIEQGDSLAKYRPVTDHESKSVILANPPFGAQRDQEAYPDVWGEYSKESETTILFVKLMFEHLRQGGRCAVVVSEGFHTWDQFSAKALRKMLLEEANLKAVISLPQGLFVSKNGQGPKTSILIFEKGGKTDWTWFYKVTNDGYTMGTNRKEQKGNQLIECLKLYHEFVKHGKKPAESKNQFCIPAEWIKTLDPRVKEKIRIETRTDMAAKGKLEKDKKAEELDKKIKSKKITEVDKQMDLKVFDQMLENRIQNEIAKRIDKAHNYSFNLANYKSTISDSQIEEWTEVLKNIKPNGATSLDDVYKRLNNSKPENILPYLLKLNPTNALETDIAREYVSNLDNDLITNHKELNVIKEILKSGAKYSTVSIKETCSFEKGKLPTQATPEGIFPFVVTAKERKSALEYQLDTKAVCIPLISSTGHGSATLNKIHYQEGKFALANLLFAAIPNCPETELYPKFLYYILDSRREELFCPLMKGTANVSMKMEDAINVRFPLPDFETQVRIVDQIEKQKAIIEGVDKLLNNWEIDENIFSGLPFAELDKHLLFVSSGSTPLGGANVYVQDEGVLFIRSQNVLINKTDFSNAVLIPLEVHEKMKRTQVKIGDVFLNITGASIGRSAVMCEDVKANVNQHVAILRPNNTLLPKYLSAVLNTPHLQIQIDKLQTGSSRQGLNFDQIRKLKIPITDTVSQLQIIEELNAQMQILEGLCKMKTEAEKKIDRILADIWGVKFVEHIKEEVSDEQEN
ncbi:MAG: N-6 DNA methylase [Clostridia bacterium]